MSKYHVPKNPEDPEDPEDYPEQPQSACTNDPTLIDLFEPFPFLPWQINLYFTVLENSDQHHTHILAVPGKTTKCILCGTKIPIILHPHPHPHLPGLTSMQPSDFQKQRCPNPAGLTPYDARIARILLVSTFGGPIYTKHKTRINHYIKTHHPTFPKQDFNEQFN